MAYYTVKGTVKNQMRSAGYPILVNDIKAVETIFKSFHMTIKLVYLKDGRVYRLTNKTVDADGNYSEASGRFCNSAELIAGEGR